MQAIESSTPFGRRPAAPPRATRSLALAVGLFTATLGTTTTLGAGLYLSTRTDVVTDLPLLMSLETVRRVWSDPALLATGLSLALPVILILLCHEMGHYVACRRYGYPVSPPFFLPVPFGLGTLGAFIRIRSPIRSKRELFDIGIAGPIAGFVVLLPILLWGIAASEPVPTPPPPVADTGALLVVPGRCLATELAIRFFHGALPPGTSLDLHPFALAGWFGLLATAFNLLPLGQLDGGHILYAVIGRRQRTLAPLLWLGLAATGWLWPGWWVWCGLVLLLGLFHPPVRDEREPLDTGRRLLALVALAMLVLSLVPVPVELVAVAG